MVALLARNGILYQQPIKRYLSLCLPNFQPYQTLADEDKVRYLNETKDYVPAESDEDDPPKKRTKGTKKKKDPNAPKAPSNAYFIYVREKREEFKAKHPDAKTTEITSGLAQQWKAMTDSEKAPFQKLAAADKVRYTKEMEDYTG